MASENGSSVPIKGIKIGKGVALSKETLESKAAAKEMNTIDWTKKTNKENFDMGKRSVEGGHSACYYSRVDLLNYRRKLNDDAKAKNR